VWPLLFLWRLLKEQQVQEQFESHWTGAFKPWACAQLGLVPLTTRGAVGWVYSELSAAQSSAQEVLIATAGHSSRQKSRATRSANT